MGFVISFMLVVILPFFILRFFIPFILKSPYGVDISTVKV